MKRLLLSATGATAIVAILTVARLSSQAGPAVGLDLAGYWLNVFHQDAGLGTGGGMLVDYGGIPVNEAGRLYALAFDASRMTVRQQQCPGYVAPYFYFAPQSYRFWEERDPITQELTAIKMYGQTSEQTRTIWMDGRPHPPAYAPHTWAGFATGKWEGHILTVYTTHLKRAWQRINGVPQGDQATLMEHFISHRNRITYVSIVNDPVYLAEPWIRSLDFVHAVRDPASWLYACDDAEQIVGRASDYIPSHLFGQHPSLREYAELRHVPLLGALGGPETTRPEFVETAKRATEADALPKTRPMPGKERASVAVDPDPHDGAIHIWQVQGNVYMLVGDGGNIAVQTSPGEAVEIFHTPHAATDGDSFVQFRRSDQTSSSPASCSPPHATHFSISRTAEASVERSRPSMRCSIAPSTARRKKAER